LAAENVDGGVKLVTQGHWLAPGKGIREELEMKELEQDFWLNVTKSTHGGYF